MTVLLYAWDYGENQGHSVRDLRFDLLYGKLSKSYFVIKKGSESLYKDIKSDRIFHAPPLTKPSMTQKPGGMAEILWKLEAMDIQNVMDRVNGWLEIIDKTKPSVVVYNYSPLAAIAAYIRNVPVLPIGTPFELSFFQRPMPSWDETSFNFDTEYLYVINKVLEAHGAKKIQRTIELCGKGGEEGVFVGCVSWMDPNREDKSIVRQYTGTSIVDYGKEMSWRSGQNVRKIFVYLNGENNSSIKILNVLNSSWWDDKCPIETIAYCPSLTKEQKKSLDRIRFSDIPVSLGPLWADMTLAISTGGTTLYKAVEMAVPSVAVPSHQEQELVAQQLFKNGIGSIIYGHLTGAAIRECLYVYLKKEAVYDETIERLQLLNDKVDERVFMGRRRLEVFLQKLGVMIPVTETKFKHRDEAIFIHEDVFEV